MGSNLPSPDRHMEVLYRQTFNTYGEITSSGLTQDNRTGNDQKKNNTRLDTNTNKGILAGSVVAVAGDGQIGACAGDTTNYDKAVGVMVNDAVGNSYESSSAVASERVVYCHGTGTVFRTDIYETKATDGTAAVTYTAGDRLVTSQNGLLTNSSGIDQTSLIGGVVTIVGVCLKAPSSTDPYMTVQMSL
jgi:hypothetical protein